MQTHIHPMTGERARPTVALIALLALGLAGGAPATTETFGTGTSQFSMTFNQAHTALVSWNRVPGAKFFLPTEAEWSAALAFIHYAPGACISEWI